MIERRINNKETEDVLHLLSYFWVMWLILADGCFWCLVTYDMCGTKTALSEKHAYCASMHLFVVQKETLTWGK